jgi:hypothetical protein
METKRLRRPQPDLYGVVHLSPSLLDPELSFPEALDVEIKRIRSESKAAWLRLKGEVELGLVPAAVSKGFRFHYASVDECILGLRFPDDELSTLPRGPSHTVGVGCVVYHPQSDSVLVVKEKHGPVAGYWKLVTGLVDTG